MNMFIDVGGHKRWGRQKIEPRGGQLQASRAGVSACFPNIRAPLMADYLGHVCPAYSGHGRAGMWPSIPIPGPSDEGR